MISREILWNKTHGHTMKLWERVIEHRLRQNVTILENQFRFMSGRSTIEAIHLLRQLIERFRERRNLHMIFIDLVKAYDKCQERYYGGH